MEKMVRVFLENSPNRLGATDEKVRSALSGVEAVVEKTLGAKRYGVSLADGTKLTALGPEGLAPGARVKVSSVPPASPLDNEEGFEIRGHPAEQWRAWLPVKWADEISEAQMEIYVQNDKTALGAKRESVVYLIFSMKTKNFGQVQWSVYLRGHQVLTQIYKEKDGTDASDVYKMIGEFESSLKKKGFSFLAPTVLLKKPFRVPAGFQLNLRG